MCRFPGKWTPSSAGTDDKPKALRTLPGASIIGTINIGPQSPPAQSSVSHSPLSPKQNDGSQHEANIPLDARTSHSVTPGGLPTPSEDGPQRSRIGFIGGNKNLMPNFGFNKLPKPDIPTPPPDEAVNAQSEKRSNKLDNLEIEGSLLVGESFNHQLREASQEIRTLHVVLQDRLRAIRFERAVVH